MRKRVHSRAGLFLIELMISVLFFSITAAIFLQVFAKSESIRKESKELFEAQMNVSSIAEVVREHEGELTGLLEQYPQAVCEKSEAVVFYDAEWKLCAKEKMVYQIAVTSRTAEDMKEIEIRALSGEKMIYKIKIKIY